MPGDTWQVGSEDEDVENATAAGGAFGNENRNGDKPMLSASLPPVNLEEWISAAELARRIQSPRAGRKTHVSTLHRWARKYGWDRLRRNGFVFFRLADVLSLFEVEPGQPPARSRQRQEQARREEERWAKETLRKHGIA